MKIINNISCKKDKKYSNKVNIHQLYTHAFTYISVQMKEIQVAFEELSIKWDIRENLRNIQILLAYKAPRQRISNTLELTISKLRKIALNYIRVCNIVVLYSCQRIGE